MKRFASLFATGLLLASATLVVSGNEGARAAEVSFEPDGALPLVYVNVAVKAGAVTDPAGQSGLTNFMGEMLLRGTKNRTKEQLNLAIDQMGANLSVETRSEALIIRGAVLKTQLEPFLALINEVLTRPSFPESEIRKLKSEITSGILEELGRDPSLASRRFQRFLFQDHPYGKPVLGTVRDISRLTRPQILAQYERLIRDPNLVVVGTGDAETSKIEAWSKALGQARSKGGKNGDKPIEKVAAPQDSPVARYQIIDKPDRTQTQINGGQIGVKLTDKNYFPLYLANYTFGGGSFSSRMMVEIRVKRGWSYGANSYFRHGLQPRLWSFKIFPKSTDTPEALAYTLGMIRNLKKGGITAEELSFAKDSLINSAGFTYNTPKKRVENKLLERTLDLPDGFMRSYAPELAKLSLNDVNSAVEQYFKPDQMAVSVLGTAKDLKAPMAKALGIKEEQIQVVPYTQE